MRERPIKNLKAMAIVRIVPIVAALAGLLISIGLGSCNKSSGRRQQTPLPVVPEATITSPGGGTYSGNVYITYLLVEWTSEPAFIEVSFSTDGGGTYQPATEFPTAASEGVNSLTTSPPPGVPHTFVWDSVADLGLQQYSGVIVRVLPFDASAGIPGISSPFFLDNLNLPPHEVISVTDSYYNATNNEVVFRFAQSLLPTSIIHQGTSSDTFAVFRDRNRHMGPTYTQEAGTIVLSDADRTLRYTPPSPFTWDLEMRFVLRSGILDIYGQVLSPGSSFPSAPLSFTSIYSDQVFEYRFVPGAGPVTGRFRPDLDSDIWFIDFDTFGTFNSDLGAHGLRGSDPTVARYSRDLVIGRLLGHTGKKYLRDPGYGSPVSGAYKISFVAIRPPGAIRVSISRMCIGLTHPLYWGAAWYDLGNANREDDCSIGVPLGVFSGGIYGLNSYLTPGLGSADLPYVDGTYVLGTDPTQDSRFLWVRNVLEDWAHALAVVNSHEVGHSVGLPHDDSSSLNIMRSWSSLDWASNLAVRFSSANLSRLNGNLGRVP
ncbi:MAG: hypothetical protein O7H41_08745 [Planctomycetota bacterium]|nr:hypothetical protein [Planctomycetota bacterium]